jgi:hypothetical protein
MQSADAIGQLKWVVVEEAVVETPQKQPHDRKLIHIRTFTKVTFL